MVYIDLHKHSDGSALDGAQSIDDIIGRTQELGQPATALTDHGTMAKIVEFIDKCYDNNIKPIPGQEFYQSPLSRFHKEKIDGVPNAFHLCLFAMNDQGLKNLYKLSSLAYTEGFYYKPRVDWELLEQYNQGLIASSACLAGIIQWAILHDAYDYAKEQAEKYLSIFGDRFYIEVQRSGLEDQELIIPEQIQLAKELSIPLIATTDAHYTRPEDAEFHEQLVCLGTAKKITDDNRMSFEGIDLYIRSEDQMLELFKDIPEAVHNTGLLADRCEVSQPARGVFHFPHVTDNDEQILREQAYQGLKTKGLHRHQQYIDRMEQELEVICSMGFASYFLIVADFIDWANKNDIMTGPGRGSAAGSLVSYCMNITRIDPIAYGLVFERFLNPGREGAYRFDSITKRINIKKEDIKDLTIPKILDIIERG